MKSTNILTCQPTVLKNRRLKCVPGARFNTTTYQTVEQKKKAGTAVLLQNGTIQPVYGYVVKAAFPIILILVVLSLMHYNDPCFLVPQYWEPGSNTATCGPVMTAGSGISAKFIGNKADNGHKGTWAFFKSQ